MKKKEVTIFNGNGNCQVKSQTIFQRKVQKCF